MKPDESLTRDLAEALRVAVARAIAPNGERFAYDRCHLCSCTWHGPRHGRQNPERERHNRECPVPQWRAALARFDARVAAPEPVEREPTGKCSNCDPDYEPSDPREMTSKCPVCGEYRFRMKRRIAIEPQEEK